MKTCGRVARSAMCALHHRFAMWIALACLRCWSMRGRATLSPFQPGRGELIGKAGTRRKRVVCAGAVGHHDQTISAEAALSPLPLVWLLASPHAGDNTQLMALADEL